MELRPLRIKTNLFQKVFSKYVTCSREDGVGSQMQGIISTILYARSKNYIYVHTPPASIQHAQGDAKEWAAKWDKLFGFGEEASSHQDCPWRNNFRLANIENGLSFFALNTVWHCHDFADKCPDLYEEILPRYRRRYLSNAFEMGLESYSGTRTIAVHIRRGDVDEKSEEPDIKKRVTTNDRIAKTISSISARFPDHRIIICSVGNEEDFGSVSDLPVEWCLNADTFQTFHLLATCSVLIMAKSSFSYLAGLFNPNVVFYEPFWHARLSRWEIAPA